MTTAHVEIKTTPFTGLDGVVYHIFSFFCTGRGWAEYRHYAATDGPTSISGTVKYEAAGMVEVLLDERYHKVMLHQFSKRPYVSKKTNVPNPHLQQYGEPKPLNEVYAALGGTVMVHKKALTVLGRT